MNALSALQVSVCFQKPGDVVVVPPGMFAARRHLENTISLIHYTLTPEVLASPNYGMATLKKSSELNI